MVTAPVEEEGKRSREVRQLEHIGDRKMGLHPGPPRPLLSLLHRQRCQVDPGDLKALLSQPDTVGSRATADFDRAARRNVVAAQSKLQLRGRDPCVPREIATAVMIVPIDGLFHGFLRGHWTFHLPPCQHHPLPGDTISLTSSGEKEKIGRSSTSESSAIGERLTQAM